MIGDRVPPTIGNWSRITNKYGIKQGMINDKTLYLSNGDETSSGDSKLG